MQARYAETTSVGRQSAPPSVASPKPKATREAKPKTSIATQSKPQQKPIELAAELPNAKSVCVAGSFNNWDQNKTPLRKEGNTWKTSIELAPGRYEYKFVVDGQWMCDPRSKECVQNDFGSSNSVLVV